VTVGPLEAPDLKAPVGIEGQEQQMISAVLARLQKTFPATAIVFTTERLATGME
jgi:hypothetical protein